MRFKNFSIWKSKLPHWRADEVTYYLTFRYRRSLQPPELQVLFQTLLGSDQKKWDILLLATLFERTELIIQVSNYKKQDEEPELSKLVEPLKSKAGKKILQMSGEKYSPFYGESYDRIIRDACEYEERVSNILCSVETLGVPDFPFLWVREDACFRGPEEM